MISEILGQKKIASDFPFHTDKSCKISVWIVAFMMYIVCFAVISCILTGSVISNWRSAIVGKLTIEFPVNVDNFNCTLTAEQQNAAKDTIVSCSGVKSARVLESSELKIMLNNIFGTVDIPDDFPMPVIFDVCLDGNQEVDFSILSEKLMRVSPGVKIYDHAKWYENSLNLWDTLWMFSFLLSITILFVICVIVVFMTYNGLKIYDRIVRILQIIGAGDQYIASQFCRYNLIAGMRSFIVCLIFSFVTFLFLYYSFNIVVCLFDILKYIIAIIVTSGFVVFLSVETTKLTVLYALRKEEMLG